MSVPLLARASARHFLRHPWQFGLAALGIALGVALAAGIDVASASVRRSFALATEAASGRATHEITGGPEGVPEAVYRRLRVEQGRRETAPFVGGAVALADRAGEVLQIVGIDPFAEAAVRPAITWDAPALRGALSSLLTQPGAALVTAETAHRLGVQAGSPIVVRVGASRSRLIVAAVVTPALDRERRALDGVLLVDVATAQETLGMIGALSRIDLRIPEDRLKAGALAAVEAVLPAGLRLQPVGARTGATLGMTRAFDLNLRALSLLALLVGAFLIYNTMTFSVVAGSSIKTTLRTLGATRRELFEIVLIEAAVLGVIGAAAGLLLGVVLGRGLVGLVARAVSDLYFTVTVREVAIPPGVVARAAVLGIGAALLSTLPAAREATGADPRLGLLRSTLERASHGRVPRLAGLGLGAVAVAALLLLGIPRSIPLALVGLLLVIVGAALLAPAATLLLARAAGPLLRAVAGLPGRMAARSVTASLSRTGVAVAALALALSVTVGVSLMVGSFRAAVDGWLRGTLAADVYVSAVPLVAARNEARLPRALVARLAALPGVAAVGSTRGVTLSGEDGPTFLAALEYTPGHRPGFRLLQGDPVRAWRALDQGQGVFVSESLAWRRQLSTGGTVALTTRTGRMALPIAGIVRDYGSDAGAVFVARSWYDRHFDDAHVSGIALHAAPGVASDALVEAVRAVARQDGLELLARSNQALRHATMQVFDRTFEVTEVLRLLALIVAAFGVTSALLALELERTRELGVLRALGFTGGQVRAMVALETGLLGAVAGLLAAPVGVVLAALLVHVINRRSFGWTMDLTIDGGTLALAPLLGIAAGLAGGLYPAWLMSRASPADALRAE